MSRLHLQHPVRVILREASLGHAPTKEMLDRLLVRDDLPEGHDLNRHRKLIADAAAEVYEKARPSANSQNHAEARRLAEHRADEIAEALSAHESALTQTEARPEDVDAIAARMFRR